MSTKPEEKPAWANLPNAAHIDRVLEHVNKNRKRWHAAWAASRAASRAAARHAAKDAVWGAARDAAWAAARDVARDVARYVARYVAWDALYALVAWDSAGALLDYALQDPKGVDALRALAETGSHAAALLIPAVIAMKE